MIVLIKLLNRSMIKGISSWSTQHKGKKIVVIGANFLLKVGIYPQEWITPF